ncbi:MAG TPA: hypothetical protein VMM56_08415 [Planctomycetaceae bacterium]|nr:hypothetical protein [Planctomycetaceae bacterium]
MIDRCSTLLILVIEMNQGKHTNLGLGILIGGLSMALFFRQPPNKNDSLPELEQTKVLERDFSLDFDEEPILTNEIDQFESLHPLEFKTPESSRTGARIQGIEVATTPERERPIPEKHSEQNRKLGVRSIGKDPAIAESGPQSDGLRNVPGNEATGGALVPATTINSKVAETAGFVLPDNLFTESFLREETKPGKSNLDVRSQSDVLPVGKAIDASDSHMIERPFTESAQPVEAPGKSPARVIIPRRIRLGEPIAGQLGMGTSSQRQTIPPRSIEVNSASAEISEKSARQNVSSTVRIRDESIFGEASDRDSFPSLDGLEPLSIPSKQN